ncbi:hypothetical protein CP960_06520 [Malaciobacter halophilus]|uniref:Phosphate ABC transporter substrate-binding protein n=1 Tax=Malaciobacter halophilus TaxID=197482 RepID=A0A2N1J359_9BACT|nr:phosphate/phosphite/phosphonate ABC transporter substrate-binding protein [Malaciobacter halophilus]AXH09644.1 phosphonate ABC transporter, periplasmic substrate-binding protein [Malaciobacter halophilus]PKI80993.1 hypothetical protein CP960_06520 [Malaciobacter halophilus]
MKRLSIFLLLATFAYSSEITLGVVPQQSPLKLSKKWLKVTSYLEQQTGIKVVFKTEISIPKFEKELYSGNYDISYMNPYHFIIANKKQNYKAFIRANKNIEGILLSKSKKVEFTKENLENKRFLFPAPNAFAATLLTKLELKEKFGFDIDKQAKVLYVNSHDSVYKGISREVGYLGGGIVRTFNNFVNNADKKNLHIVYKTSSYPSHPIAFHPNVDKKIINKLENAFLKMPEELKKLLSIKNFIKTNSNEYEVIKKLDVENK